MYKKSHKKVRSVRSGRVLSARAFVLMELGHTPHQPEKSIEE